MKKRSLRERFGYWLDNKMAKGTAAMTVMLLIATLLVVALLALIIYRFDPGESESFLDVFYNSLATTINAWMPEADSEHIAGVAIQSLMAIIGIFFTSVLIGIVGSAVEEKITNLRKGNSTVLETGHIVVLGFREGEYTLISQLIDAAGTRRECIVMAGDMEKDEMEDAIKENVDIPKNVRIICRKADITDPVSIASASIPDCRTVIIDSQDDSVTVKAILAVSNVLKDSKNKDIRVVAAIGDDVHWVPHSAMKGGKLTLADISGGIAMIIAHSAAEPGISRVFSEVFNFEGNEFYHKPVPEAEAMSFGEVVYKAEDAAPVGIVRDGKVQTVPDAEEIIRPGDEIVYFAEGRDSIKLGRQEYDLSLLGNAADYKEEGPEGTIVLIGYNDSFETVLENLPRDAGSIVIAGVPEEKLDVIKESVLDARRKVSIFTRPLTEDGALDVVAEMAEHVVILSNGDKDAEEADLDTMVILIYLRDIRKSKGLGFTVTAEIRTEKNKVLVDSDDDTDFIVASDLSAMALSQISESLAIRGLFREIFSNKGKELCLRKPSVFSLADGDMTIRDIRMKILGMGYVLLGYTEKDRKEFVFNPAAGDTVSVKDIDRLIVIG